MDLIGSHQLAFQHDETQGIKVSYPWLDFSLLFRQGIDLLSKTQWRPLLLPGKPTPVFIPIHSYTSFTCHVYPGLFRTRYSVCQLPSCSQSLGKCDKKDGMARRQAPSSQKNTAEDAEYKWREHCSRTWSIRNLGRWEIESRTKAKGSSYCFGYCLALAVCFPFYRCVHSNAFFNIKFSFCFSHPFHFSL